MSRIPTLSMTLLLLAASTAAQTTNVAGVNEALVQGEGSGGTSPILYENRNDGGGLRIEFDAVPNAPFVMAISQDCVPGNLPVQGGYTVDHDFPTVQYVLDGTGVLGNSGALQPFLHTGPTGQLSFELPNVNTAEFCTQFAFVDPSFPQGIATSGAFEVTYGAGGRCLGLDPSFTVNTVSLGDDDFAVASTPLFFFYGNGYTEFYVNSNGSLTFGAGDNNWGESVSSFLADEPRIAAWWDDLNPSQGGTISTFTNNTGQAGVCFEDVPEFPASGANNFRVLLTNANVVMTYGEMTSNDGLVGVSPGGNLDPTGTPIDLTGGMQPLSGNVEAYYERFDGSNPRDFGFGMGIEFNYGVTGSNPSLFKYFVN